MNFIMLVAAVYNEAKLDFFKSDIDYLNSLNEKYFSSTSIDEKRVFYDEIVRFDYDRDNGGILFKITNKIKKMIIDNINRDNRDRHVEHRDR